MSAIMEQLARENLKTDIPDFRAGDTITVSIRVIEGNKERVQSFKGVVIQRKNSGIHESVTVRKMSGQVAVERIFPIHSPVIESIILDRKGKVRQGRIFYMRELKGKAARIKERK
jgi:large subunit ribosomal protein L19